MSEPVSDRQANTVTTWSDGKLGAAVGLLWTCAAIIWGNDVWQKAALWELLLLVALYSPTILVAAWSRRQPQLAQWHWGKPVLLWVAAASLWRVAEYWRDDELSLMVITAIAPPLFVLTWGWMSHRR